MCQEITTKGIWEALEKWHLDKRLTNQFFLQGGSSLVK
jgi:hypothetical protein